MRRVSARSVASSASLRLALIVDNLTTETRLASARRGAQLGAEEAQHAATLFGKTVELTISSDAERLIEARGADVLLGGFEIAGCAHLASSADTARVPFLNVGCTSDALREESCRRHAFHVAASESMERDARAVADASEDDGDVLLWHESLERFGAEQLNARFHARFAVGMDSVAWAAWMAVKIAAESWFRVPDGSVARLLEVLERSSTRFDGHKGRPLSFRSWDHQLRQPLYVLGGSASAGDVREVPPGRGAAGTAVEQLDRIGTPAAESRCRWSAT